MGSKTTTIMSIRIPVDLKSQIEMIQKNSNVRTKNDMMVRLLNEAVLARMKNTTAGENPLLTEVKMLIHNESEFIINQLRPEIQRVDWMVAKAAKYIYVIRYLVQDFEGLILDFHGRKNADAYVSKIADKFWEKSRIFFDKTEKKEEVL